LYRYISACLDNDVTRLLYTSTYNTIFGGQTIENGDETLPYHPLDKVENKNLRCHLMLLIVFTMGFRVGKCNFLSRDGF